MKLRLPHQFQAALMAAIASVSLTTLSTGSTAYCATVNSVNLADWEGYNASTGIATVGNTGTEINHGEFSQPGQQWNSVWNFAIVMDADTLQDGITYDLITTTLYQNNFDGYINGAKMVVNGTKATVTNQGWKNSNTSGPQEFSLEGVDTLTFVMTRTGSSNGNVVLKGYANGDFSNAVVTASVVGVNLSFSANIRQVNVGALDGLLPHNNVESGVYQVADADVGAYGVMAAGYQLSGALSAEDLSNFYTSTLTMTWNGTDNSDWSSTAQNWLLNNATEASSYDVPRAHAVFGSGADLAKTVEVKGDLIAGSTTIAGDYTFNMTGSLNAGKITIAEGASLARTGSGALTGTLSGAGTYILPSGTSTLGVTLGTDWSGTVRVTDYTPGNGQDFSRLRTDNSTLELKGFNGWTSAWEGTNNYNFKLTNGSNGYAWQNGAFGQNNATHIMEFTGKWSGDGLFLETGGSSPRNMHYTYSGNITDWVGEFRHNAAQVTDLTFKGSATNVNIAISKGTSSSGTFTVVADAAGIIFNKAITADSLKVNAGASATTKGAASFASLTGAGNLISNAALTLGGAADCTFTGTVSGSGSIEKVGTGKQSVTGNMVDFTGGITVTAGTLDIDVTNSYGSITTHAVSVAEGATLNLVAGGTGGNLNANGTIYNAGTVKLTAETLALNPSDHTAFELYEGENKYTGTGEYAGSGFLNSDAKYYLVKGIGAGTISSYLIMDSTGGYPVSQWGEDAKDLLVKLDFSGGNDTYYVNGNLTYSNAEMGTANTISIANAATLTVASPATIKAVAGGGGLVNNAALTLGGAVDSTFTGTVSGSGSIEKVGTGTQSVTGNMVDFAGDITVTAGTLDIDVTETHGSITTHAVNVAEGTTLNLVAGGYGGALNANGTIYNNGNINIVASDLVLNPDNHTSYEVYGGDQKYTGTGAAAGSGFLNADARYYLVKGGENSSYGSSAYSIWNVTHGEWVGPTEKDILVKLDFSDSELEGTYYVNGNMTTHDDVKDSKYDILSATDIVIEDGVTLTASTNTDAFTNSAMLHGKGTYALANGQAAFNSNLSLGTDWSGIVRVSGYGDKNTQLDGTSDIRNLARAGSKVELHGVSGWINTNWSTDLILTGDNQDGTGTAIDILNGGSGQTREFSGSIIGSGDFSHSWNNAGGSGNQNYVFSGDVKNWTGTFKVSGNKGDIGVEFKGGATVIGASILQSRNNTLSVKITNENDVVLNGAINYTTGGIALNVAANTTFSESVKVSSLTINEGKSATFNGALDVSGAITVGTGSTLTLAGETAIAQAISNDGTVVFTHDITATGLAVTTSDFNVDLDGREISTDFTNANYFAGAQKGSITVVDGGTVTPNNRKVVQGDVEYTLGADGKAVRTVKDATYSTFYQHEEGSELTLSAINAVATPHRAMGVSLVDVQDATLKIDSGYLYQVVAKDATIEVASSESVSVLEFIGGDNTVVGQVAAFEDHAAKFRRNVESSVDLKNADNSAYTMDLSSQDGVKFSTTAVDGGVVTISAAAEEDADEAYTASESRYTVAATELAKAAQGNVTVGNHVEVSKVSNDASTGKLTLSSGAAAAKLKEVSATSGDIEFYNMNATDQANLNTLNIGEGRTVSMYTGNVAEVAQEASVTVTGTLTAGEGAHLNANLVMESGSKLDVSADGGMQGLIMGSTVTLNGDSTLLIDGNDANKFLRDYFGGSTTKLYTLYSGEVGDPLELYIGDQKMSEITFDAWNKPFMDASSIYSNLQEKTYYLVYNPNHNNVGMVAIGFVPEPTTSTLSLLALCALAARRRRKA